jgi:hypothetical protein
VPDAVEREDEPGYGLETFKQATALLLPAP